MPRTCLSRIVANVQRTRCPGRAPRGQMSARAVIQSAGPVYCCRDVVKTNPTLLSRMRRLRVLMLFVALFVVAKSGIACGCRQVELGQDLILAASLSAATAASPAVSDVSDSDPSPVGSTLKSVCKHCFCQQPSLPPPMVLLVSFVVPPVGHLWLPASDASNWATSPFRPPISKRLA